MTMASANRNVGSGCNGEKRTNKSRLWRTSESSTTFFKVLIKPDLARLPLSGNFCATYGGRLPKRMSLKIKNGAVWEVEVVHDRVNGQCWLRKGWPEFVQDCSIEFGYFLILEFDGNAQFDVSVFTRSTHRVEYLSVGEGTGHEDCNQVSDQDENKSDECLNELPVIQKDDVKKMQVATTSQGKFRGMRKAMDMANKKDAGTKDHPPARTRAQKMKLQALNPEVDMQIVKPEIGEGGTGPLSSSEWEIVSYEHNQSSTTSYQSANRSKPDNSWDLGFKRVMQESYVSEPFRLRVPIPFARQKFTTTRSNNKVKLQLRRVLDGKTWPAECRVYPREAKVIHGWKEFVEDNGLEVGDECIFEMANSGPELTLDVTKVPRVKMERVPLE